MIEMTFPTSTFPNVVAKRRSFTYAMGVECNLNDSCILNHIWVLLLLSMLNYMFIISCYYYSSLHPIILKNSKVGIIDI